jgi:hypothetical protein
VLIYGLFSRASRSVPRPRRTLCEGIPATG